MTCYYIIFHPYWNKDGISQKTDKKKFKNETIMERKLLYEKNKTQKLSKKSLNW